MLYSPSVRGFFLPEVHGASVPQDAVSVSKVEYEALLSGQQTGKVIVPGTGGKPELQEVQPPSAAQTLAAEREAMVVSRFQARAALHIAGLLVQVEAAVAASDAMTQMAWQDAREFRRNSPTIAALAAAIDLTDEQIDDLFRSAAQIVA